MLKCNEPGTLYTATRNLLNEDNRNIATISIEAGIPYPWLITFREGKFNNASVNRIQYLFEFLTQSKLPL